MTNYLTLYFNNFHNELYIVMILLLCAYCDYFSLRENYLYQIITLHSFPFSSDKVILRQLSLFSFSVIRLLIFSFYT